jgi:hypothetical protein
MSVLDCEDCLCGYNYDASLRLISQPGQPNGKLACFLYETNGDTDLIGSLQSVVCDA